MNDIEKLFKTHYLQMLRLAVGLLHDEDSARDLVHDVFATLLDDARKRNMPDVPGTAYLLSAVRNRCLNLIRDMGTRERVTNRYFLENDEYDSEDWPDDETIVRIYQIINGDLTPQCKRVMELRFIDGLRFSKVASTLGISENAVYKHVRQALVIIRKNLNQNG
ncbi:MAG: sigma-70 family RNA polymerase sigma factor [Staphylococcus sp.]|nr:sigma-70 family RNA polymerase sigma factor [Staphylococcus sp.]